MSTSAHRRWFFLGACLALAAHAGGEVALWDTVDLRVAKGPGAGQNTLSWTGGAAPYFVHRGGQSSGLLVPANQIATTSGTSYTDAASPAPGGAFFYSVVDQWPLTLDKSGTGGVTRDGSAACSPACPERTWHANGSTVVLVALPQNGSGYFFTGWSGACAGAARTCSVTMTQARSVTANFGLIVNNLAFVSSSNFATTLGGALAYDTQCNTLASAAGINNAAGNAFVAWISDGFSNAVTRLGAARGWVRMDGKPFTDTQAGLLSGNVIFFPLRLDETGADTGARTVMTGTSQTGATGSHCGSWTGTGTMTCGDAAWGPGGWTIRGSVSCATPARIYCLMNTKTQAVTINPEPGKRIYLSAAVSPTSGLAGLDARCMSDKPAGTGTVKALVATSTSSAVSRLAPTQRYVRPDGVFVASSADFSSGALLTSGIWQTGAGAYVAMQSVFTGATSPSAIGSAGTNCTDWTSSFGTAITGVESSTEVQWWNSSSGISCNSINTRVYCAEQ